MHCTWEETPNRGCVSGSEGDHQQMIRYIPISSPLLISLVAAVLAVFRPETVSYFEPHYNNRSLVHTAVTRKFFARWVESRKVQISGYQFQCIKEKGDICGGVNRNQSYHRIRAAPGSPFLSFSNSRAQFHRLCCGWMGRNWKKNMKSIA